MKQIGFSLIFLLAILSASAQSSKKLSDMWAQIETDIGSVYNHLGKQLEDKALLDKAYEFYLNASDVFENLGQTSKVKEIENVIIRLSDQLKLLN